MLFRSDVCLLDPEMLVFLDESGFVCVYLPSNTTFRSLVYYYLALIVQWSQFNLFVFYFIRTKELNVHMDIARSVKELR